MFPAIGICREEFSVFSRCLTFATPSKELYLPLIRRTVILLTG